MLTDRERRTWREIQRRLVEDSDFQRAFHAVERHGPGDHLRLPRHSTVLVTLVLTILLLVGPSLLTDDETTDRQRPTPQESSALARLGVEWVPAWEKQWLVGPSDTDPFRSFDAPVSTPPSGFVPSAAA